MRFPRSYLAVIASILCFAQGPSASEAQPKIVVVVAPVATYVGALTQNVAKVQGLLQPGQDPHHFSLSPSQAEMLEGADILITPDLSMSPIITTIIAKHPKMKVIELSALTGAEPLPYATENPWLVAVKKEDKKGGSDAEIGEQPSLKASHEDDYKRLGNFDEPQHYLKKESAATDPHFWLDPERMAAIALPLANAIGDFSPANRATLQGNAKILSAHLRQDVLPQMRALLAARRDRHTVSEKRDIPFVTYHAAYQYFLARFNLAHEGEITTRPEDYLGAKSLDGLLNAAKQVHIHCVIGEANSSLITRIAALSNAHVVILSPEQNIGQHDAPPLDWVQNDYDRLLYKTAKSFGECL